MPSIKLSSPKPTVTEKRCYVCGKRYPVSGFLKNDRSADGYANECKPCCNLRKQREKKARLSRASNLSAGYVRVCSVCHASLPIDDFTVFSDISISTMCKGCERKSRPMTEREKLNMYLTKNKRRR